MSSRSRRVSHFKKVGIREREFDKRLFFQRQRDQGREDTFSVREGLSSVCARLQQQLQTQVMLDTEVMSCTRDKGRWTINTNKGNILADAVISALPAFVLSRVIKTEKSSCSHSAERNPLPFTVCCSYWV